MLHNTTVFFIVLWPLQYEWSILSAGKIIFHIVNNSISYPLQNAYRLFYGQID